MSDASFNEQLLTALFDGELQGAERERAEKLLAENSECQQMFQAWQTQAERIRTLPRYQLDDNFAQSVIQAIESQTVPATGVLANWQTGFAAIVTLAAMLLLTLFVFPNIAGFQPVAGLAPSLEAESLEISDHQAPADRFSLDSAVGETREKVAANAGLARDASPIRKEIAVADGAIRSRGGLGLGDATESDVAESDVAEKTELPASNSSLSEFVERESAGIEPAELASDTNAMVPGIAGRSSRSLSGAAARAAPNPKSAAARAANRPAVGFGAKTDSTNDISAFADRGSSVEQILWIDMHHREKPLAEVETVFARNSIRLLNSALGEPLIGESNQVKNAQTDGDFFSTRPGSGMEALYVVATASQMRQAIVELSDQASIAAYQVPRTQLQLGIGGIGSVESAVDLAQGAPEQAKLAREQHPSIEALETNRQSAAPLASAQQLLPYQLGNSPIAISSSGSQPPDNTLGQSVQMRSETLQPGGANVEEIREIDRWFRLPNRDTEGELVQYLLFVRTSPVDSAVGSAAESDRDEAGAGAADK